jgi:choline monooxygenase
MDYIFDDHLARAATLPSRWYTDPRILEQEKASVFYRTWQLVARSDQLSAPGDYVTAMVAGESIIVARGADEKLRAFTNVCRHRAGPVAEGCGNRKVFQCGYHGWTYTLEGRLHRTPEFDGVEQFAKEDNCLPELRVETWGALVFVNLDPVCPPLAETLEDIPTRLAHLDLSSMRFAARKDWYVDCNWKTYVDNYLEGYHIPIVHPSLNRELDYGEYRTETRLNYSIQHAPIKRTVAGRLRQGEGEGEAQYFWVFPNLMLNVYPDNYSTNLIVQLGPERTLTVFEWYFLDPEREDVQEKLKETIAFSDEIQLEDIAICEAVQRGLRSKFYDRGRYSVKRENGLHHFHGLLSDFFHRK